MNKYKYEILITSFLILFLELAFIRYLPAQITYLGYYTNFILLASFIGLGVGIILARYKFDFVQLFPLSMLLLVFLSTFFSILVAPSEGELRFTNPFFGIVVSEIFAVPIVFLTVAFIFICLAQYLGRLFLLMPPLSAYAFDIGGSLLGIAMFTLFAWLGLGPIVWFGVVLLIFLLIHYRNFSNKKILISACVLILLVIFQSSKTDIWSPYQKITLHDIENGYALYVNNIGHQSFGSFEKEEIYKLPYQLFGADGFDRALIIGAGTGTDVEVALQNNVKEIDAIEIDPKIYQIGKDLNPNKPYDSPRVNVYIDDARSFLQKTDKKYDLIVYGLPDSLVLAGSGHLRLESFLLTEESFTSAKNHLTDDGVMVMYNYYRQPWLVQKLAGTVKSVFGSEPYVYLGDRDSLALIAAGPRLEKINIDIPHFEYAENLDPATDNWPFPYLKQYSLPWQYLLMLAFILFASYCLIHFGVGIKLYKTIEPTYFFLGVAFMLLETIALVKFALLFGTTWIVNSMVFFALLSFIFLAIFIAKKVRFKNLNHLYFWLGVSLIIQYFFPITSFLHLQEWIRYILASILILTPVFIANLIFSATFKTSQENDVNFASNILGAVLGGVLEYFALLVGYHDLIWLVLVCYILAFFFPMLKLKILRFTH